MLHRGVQRRFNVCDGEGSRAPSSKFPASKSFVFGDALPRWNTSPGHKKIRLITCSVTLK